MPRSEYTHKMVNGERVELTEAEIDECMAREEAHNAEKPARAMAQIRAERDKRLSDCDVVMLEDHPKNGNKAAWVNYRGELRDLPATINDPEAFVAAWQADENKQVGWPTEPV